MDAFIDNRPRPKPQKYEPLVIKEDVCTIGRPKPICDKCDYGIKTTKGKYRGWYCNEFAYSFKCAGSECKLNKVTKCDICGFKMWNKYVFEAHMKKVHGLV